jgi:hypothetical protein
MQPTHLTHLSIVGGKGANLGGLTRAGVPVPGWTALFVHAAGVVTEVGGLMTRVGFVERVGELSTLVSIFTDPIRRGNRNPQEAR